MRSFLYIPLFGFSFFFTVVLSSSKLKKRDILYDVFGMTKYGFRCGTNKHLKADLYAVALNGCRAMVKNRDRLDCGAILCQTDADRARDISFSEDNFQYSFGSFSGPFLLYPILRSLDLFEDGCNLSPGPDRLVMNRNCEVISVITNEAGENDPPTIEACQTLTSSFSPPLSPARAPASFSPPLSPARAPASFSPPLSPARAPAPFSPPLSPARAPALMPQQPVLSPGRLNSIPIQVNGVGTLKGD